MLECAGLYQPLFVVKGSCLGMEIALDTEGIPFGTVVQRSQSTRKLVMSNTDTMICYTELHPLGVPESYHGGFRYLVLFSLSIELIHQDVIQILFNSRLTCSVDKSHVQNNEN